MNRSVLLLLTLALALVITACGNATPTDLNLLTKKDPDCVDYKDDKCDKVSVDGRMTGGINILTDGMRVTGGLTLHCDSPENGLSNNLQINWEANRWHLDKNSLSNILCTKPFDPTPPAAPLSTFTAQATGKLNGIEGSSITFTLQDKGEPGRNDTVSFVIRDADGNAVLEVPETTMERGGNIQAHFDQPHK